MVLHDGPDSVSSRAAQSAQSVARFPLPSGQQTSSVADGSIWHLLRETTVSAPSLQDHASRGGCGRAFEQLLPASKSIDNPENTCVGEHMEHTAVSLSSATESIALNFEQFAKEATSLACQFKKDRNIQPGDRVALLLSNGATYAISLYAVASIGAIAVNLSSRLTAEEIESQLSDTKVSAIVTDDIFENKLGVAMASLSCPASIFLSPLFTVKSIPVPRYSTPLGEGSSPQGAQRLKFHILACNVDEDAEPLHSSAKATVTCDTLSEYYSQQDLAPRLFQLLFTSGTTGRMKGVVHTQRQVTLNADQAVIACRITHNDLWLHAAPMFHAMDAFATFAMTLVRGGQITGTATESSAALFDVGEIARIMAVREVTMTALAATHLEMLLSWCDSYTSKSWKSGSLSSLRLLSCGGSPVPSKLIERLLTRAPGVSYFTDYGMTEAGGRMCTSLLTPVEAHIAAGLPSCERANLLNPAGRITNRNIEVLVAKDISSETGQNTEGINHNDHTREYVPDRYVSRRKLCPVKCDGHDVGEVLIRGTAMFTGYWDSFSLDVSNGPGPGEWFRTGDAAVVNSHGWLVLVDRIKDVIITGGENVFCPEVESVLASHPRVCSGIVFGVPDDTFGEVVEAVVLLKETEDRNTRMALVQEIKERCTTLAPFKRPRSIAVLEPHEVPRTSTGKVNKRLLRNKIIKRLDSVHDAHDIEVVHGVPEPFHDSNLSREHILTHVRNTIAEITSVDAHLSALNEDATLVQAGLHSAAAVELSRQLNASFLPSEPYPALLAFNHPTIGSIVNHILTGGGDCRPRARPVNHVSSRHVDNNVHDVARIISRSGVLPGSDSASASFYLDGEDCFFAKNIFPQTTVPTSRWDLDHACNNMFTEVKDGYGMTIVPRFSAYLSHQSMLCDTAIVGSSYSEIVAMDPGHRLVTQHSVNAVSNVSSVVCFDSCIFVGCMWGGEWALYLHTTTAHGTTDDISSSLGTGAGSSFAAGRVAYTLDLKGESVAVDTACSSSLVALHLAHSTLICEGDAHLTSIACGVSLVLSAATMANIARMGTLSTTGRCKTLDASADGFGRSEGCMALVLESGKFDSLAHVHESISIEEQEKSFQHPSSIALLSTVTNQDGRSSSLTAPNGESQQYLINDAIDKCIQVLTSTMSTKSPLQLVSVMLHGTATPLGDPIEVAALALALSRRCSDGLKGILLYNGTYLSAPKSTLGHAEGASGLHSFMAGLTTLEHRLSAPVAHLRHLSAHILPVVRKSTKSLLTPIQRNGVSELPHKTAAAGSGCSAFGLSGVNSHAVISLRFNSDGPCMLAKIVRIKGKMMRAWPNSYLDGLLDKPCLLSHLLRGGASAQVVIFHISDGPILADLHDHCICDVALLPAATALCIAASAARSCLSPRCENIDIIAAHVVFALPVHLHETSSRKVNPSRQVNLQPKLSCTILPCGAIQIQDRAIKGNILPKYNHVASNHESTCQARQPTAMIISRQHVDSTNNIVAHACRSHHVKEVGEHHSINSHGVSSQILDSLLHLGFELNVRVIENHLNKGVAVPTSLHIIVMKEAPEPSSLACGVLTNEQDSRMTEHTANNNSNLFVSIHGFQTKHIVTSALLAGKTTVTPPGTVSDSLNISTYSTELFATSHYKDEKTCLQFPRCVYAVKATLSCANTNPDSCYAEDPVYFVCSTLSLFQQLYIMPKCTRVAVLLEDTGSTGSTVSSSVQFTKLSRHAAVDGIAQTSSLEIGQSNKVTCVRRDPRCAHESVSQENGSVTISQTVFHPALLPARVSNQRSRFSVSQSNRVNSFRDITNQIFCRELQTFQTTNSFGWRLLSAATVPSFKILSAGLIFGGTGGLGRLVHEWFNGESLFSRSCLTGRTGRSSLLLQGAGMTVTLKCDSANQSEAQCCTDTFSSSQASLTFPNADTVLLHASGSLSDSVVQNQQVYRVRNAMVPKIRALSEIMHRSVVGLTRPFTGSIMFSSVAALLGSAGQANYVSANAALDAYVLKRRLSGSADISIQWGAWKDAGMAARDEATLSRVERLGVRAMPSDHGLTILSNVLQHCISGGFLAQSCQNCIIAAGIFDWQLIEEKMLPLPPKCSVMLSLIRESSPESLAHDADKEVLHLLDDAKSTASSKRERFSLIMGRSSQYNLRETHTIIARLVADLTGTDGVDPETPFMSAGIDSLASMRLKSELESTFNFQLSATAMYDYPTIAALSLHVFTELGGEATVVPQVFKESQQNKYLSSLSSRKPFACDGRDILVTGSSVRMPALEHKSKHLTPWDAMTRVPRARWDMQAYIDSVEKCLPFLGGFMEGVELFDSSPFGIAQIEALLMDPQHRQLLEMFVHACSVEECTMFSRADALIGGKTGSSGSGAFVGIADQAYQHAFLLEFWGKSHPYIATGNTLSCAAGRICFVFAMHGPALSVDTACSSSIVSTHLATTALWNGEIDRAAACGAHSIIAVDATATFFAAGMLSPDSRCKTMDAEANGYVRGEAIGILIIEACAADRTFDIDCAVMISSTAVNQDGRSSGLTAPSGLAQQAVISIALSAGALKPADLQTLQMHGTGTSLGDPIEVNASLSALQHESDRNGTILTLEAVKSYVGHTECASGILGIMQPVNRLSIMLSAHVLHLTNMNVHIQNLFCTRRNHTPLPARVCRQRASAQIKDMTSPSACGVGSFAFQGTNGQCIVSKLSVGTSGSQIVPGLKSTFALLERSRCWPLPAPHAIFRSFSCSKTDPTHTWRLQASLDPRLHAHFWDHRVMGRALFPGAGFFEAGLAGIFLTLSSVEGHDYAQLSLLQCVVPTPMIIQDPSTSLSNSHNSQYSGHSRGKVLGLEWCTSARVPQITISSMPSTNSVRRPSRSQHLSACLSLVISQSNTKPSPYSYPYVGFGIRSASVTSKEIGLGMIDSLPNDRFLDYHVHPASVDCSMQLGGGLATDINSSSVTMIPVSTSSFMAPFSENKCHKFLGTTRALSRNRASPATQTSDHTLASLQSKRTCSQISGLIVREVQHRQDTTVSKTRTREEYVLKERLAGVLPRQITYAVKWHVLVPTRLSAFHDVSTCSEISSSTKLKAALETISDPRHFRVTLATMMSLLQNGSSGVLKTLIHTFGASVFSNTVTTPIGSDTPLQIQKFEISALNGVARAAAQELRRTHFTAVDVDVTSHRGLNHCDANPYLQHTEKTHIPGTLQEISEHVAQTLVSCLCPADLPFTAAYKKIYKPTDPTLLKEDTLVRLQKVDADWVRTLQEVLCEGNGDRSTSGFQAARDSSAAFCGFSGILIRSRFNGPAANGLAVFGVFRESQKMLHTSSMSDDIIAVDTSCCSLLPKGFPLEIAAKLPEMHVIAQTCLSILILNEYISNSEGVVWLQDHPTCAVSAALAARLNDAGIGWISSRDTPSSSTFISNTKVAAVVGAFGTTENICTALECIAQNGLLIKTSRKGPEWCTQTLHDVYSDHINNAASAATFVHSSTDIMLHKSVINRPDVVFVVDALDDHVLLQHAPRAMTWLERALMFGKPALAAECGYFKNHTFTIDFFQAHILDRSPTCSMHSLPLSPSKSIIITGGLGAIGIKTAAWLTMSDQVHIHLLGRSGRSKSSDSGNVMTGRSCITAHRADTSSSEDCQGTRDFVRGRRDKNSMRTSIDTYDMKDEGVGTVLHASGILRDAMIVSQHVEGMRQVKAAKMSSAFNLTKMIFASAVETVIMFSSVAAMLGSAGQSTYSGANNSLDHIAHVIKSKGVIAASVQWGAWDSAGMAIQGKNVLERMERIGMGVLQPEEGIAALEKVLAFPRDLVVCPFSWERLAKTIPMPDLCRDVIKTAQKPNMKRGGMKNITESIIKLRQSSTSNREQLKQNISNKIVVMIGNIVGREIDPNEPLMDAGLDSLGGVELKQQLESEFGIELPDTVIFDYPTAEDLATYISDMINVRNDDARPYFGEAHDGLQQGFGQTGTHAIAPQSQTFATSASSHLAARKIITSAVSAIVGREIDPNEPLMDAGLDSLGGVELKQQLESEFGIELPDTVIFDYPTAEDLATYISQKVDDSLAGENNQVFASYDDIPDVSHPQGVFTRTVSHGTYQEHSKAGKLGMISKTKPTVTVFGASITPTSSINASRLSNFVPSGDSVSRVPRERWDVEHFWDIYLDAEPASKLVPPHGTFLEKPDMFDSEIFNLSRSEACVMDVQQRQLLENLLRARTGVKPSLPYEKSKEICGVYVGISSTDFLFEHVRPTATELNAYILSGNVLSVAAGRLSFIFALRGPSLAIDTACSSSIVSAHVASKNILDREITTALSCGVSVVMSVLVSGLFNAAGMLSSDGRCKTLDISADGYVRGEACGVIILASLSDEDNIENNSNIIVGGSAVNQDGRSSSLTAPNGPSQQTVIRTALRDASVEGRDIQIIQLHGTGTALGDPIELGSVFATYLSYPHRDSLVLQAVKSMVGHTETAAGVMSITQPLAHLVSCTSAEITHLKSLNPVIQNVFLSAQKIAGHISSPVSQRQKAGIVKTSTKNDIACAVSGFAFQGTNGHLITLRNKYELRVHSVGGALSNFFLFESSRHWVLPDVHTLVQETFLLSQSTGHAIAKIDPRTNGFFWEHKVSRRPLFPASGFLDVAMYGTTMLGGSSRAMQYEKVINSGSLQTPLLLKEPASEACIFISIDFHDENVGAHVTIDSTEHSVGNSSFLKVRRGITSTTHLRANCERTISATSRVNIEDNPNANITGHFYQAQIINYIGARQIAHGFATDGNTHYAPYGVHPALLDSALHLATACHSSFTENTNTSDLMIPAAFACYTTVTGNERTQLERRLTADVGRSQSTKHDATQTSNHFLTPLNDGLSVNVSELFVRQLRVQGSNVSGASTQPVEMKPAHLSARDMMYTICWQMSPNKIIGGRRVTYFNYLRFPSLLDNISRITCTAAQALQLQNEGVKSSLQTNGHHPMRATSIMPCMDRSSTTFGMASLWGLWSVAAVEARGKQRSLDAFDVSPNAASISQMSFPDSSNLAYSSGALISPHLIKREISTEFLLMNQEPARGMLITGGLGGLGLLIASWFALRTEKSKIKSSFADSRPSVLLSRAGRTSNLSFERLAKAPASIQITNVDNASTEALTTACSLSNDKEPSAITVHTAGALRDALLVRQTVYNFRETTAPKVSRAVVEQLFHLMTAILPTNATVAFSSIATLIGSPGQAPYSAANAALESVMNSERAKGCVARAIAWGAWQEVGMAAAGAAYTADRLGIGSIKPSTGLSALLNVLRMDATVSRSTSYRSDHGNLVVSPFNWRVLATSRKDHKLPIPSVLKGYINSFTDEMEYQPSSSKQLKPSPLTSRTTNIPYQYAGLRGAAAVEKITKRLIQLISESTGAILSADDPLMESGLDSITGIELQQQAEQEFNIELGPTATLDHPNPAALGRHIAETMGLLQTKHDDMLDVVKISKEHATEHETVLSRAVATYAGDVDGIMEFWKHMAYTNTDPQTQVALARYDIDDHYHPITVHQMGFVTTRFGAFLNPDVCERFDSELLHISSLEALHLDPQQRLLLETCAKCLLTEPYASSMEHIRDFAKICGVFVGCMYNEVPHLQQIYHVDAGAHAGTGSGAAFMCGRISYVFALTGPCVSTDTACSSSLVASHLARRSVEIGECQEGLAAGINLALTYLNTSVICAIGALSVVGRCKALDVAADGYGRGEGSGAFLIHSAISEWESETSSPHAKITASAVNQDGRSSALTAPHGPSQVVLLRDIARQELASSLGKVNTDEKERFIAMHGTGTSLGDPIEVGALSKYATSISEIFHLHAPKTHYGHTEGAAGIAGIFTAVGFIERSEVAPIKHLRTLNTFAVTAIISNKAHSKISLNVKASRSHAIATAYGSRSRFAGTSSFGMSGVNAHASISCTHSTIQERDLLGKVYHFLESLRFVKRFSYFPRPIQTLVRWTFDADIESFHISLDTPRVSFIFDHVVAGRPLLSAAATLTITQGSAQSFPSGDNLGDAAVVDTSFSSPLILKMGKKKLLTLLRYHNGNIRLVSDSNMVQLHVASKMMSVYKADRYANEKCKTKRCVHERRTFKNRRQSVLGHIQAPCREDEWVDHESIDGSFHMLAFINVDSFDTSQVPKTLSQKMKSSNTRTLAQVPASLAAWHFNRARRGHQPGRLIASAVDLSDGASDDKEITSRSDHTLQPNAFWPILSLAKGLLVKSMLLSIARKDAKHFSDKLIMASTTHLHYVQWEAIPIDRHADAVKETPFHMYHLCFFPDSGACREGSYSVTRATAAAISNVQQVDVVRFRQNNDILFLTRGSSTAGALHEAGRCSDDILVVTRGAAQHALARTFNQELVGSIISSYDITRTEQFTGHEAVKHLEHINGNDLKLRIGRKIDCRYGAYRRGSTQTIPEIAAESKTRFALSPTISSPGSVLVHVIAATFSPNDALRVKYEADVASSVHISYGCRVFIGTIVETNDEIHSRFAAGDYVLGLFEGPISRYLKVGFNNIVRAPRMLVAGEPARVVAQLHDIVTSNFSAQPGSSTETSKLYFATMELLKAERIESANFVSDSVGSVPESCQARNSVVFAPSGSGPCVHKVISKQNQTTRLFVLAGQDGSISAAHPDASTALISGGIGALGAHTSLWLATRGSIQHFVSSSRSGRSRKSSGVMKDLCLSASQVKMVNADVSASEDTQIAISQCTASPGFAIVHAGGILADANVASQTFGGVQAVMAPKVTGLSCLSASTAVSAGAVGTIIGFSSITALLGAAGQENYAAANASLDAAVSSTKAAGRLIISIQWGAWSGGGMADASVVQRTRRMGVGALHPLEGLNALSLLLAGLNDSQRSAVIAVSPFEWVTFLSILSRPNPSFFNRVKSSDGVIFATDDARDGMKITETSKSTPEADAQHAVIHLADESKHLDAIVENVTRIVHDVTSVNISRSDPLMESGVDSLAGIELKNKIESAYGVELPATAAFDYPSIDALAQYLVENINMDESEMQAKPVSKIRIAADVAVAENVTRSRDRSRNVAILGYAGFSPEGPGISFSLTRCDDNVCTIPVYERWDHDLSGVIDQAGSNNATTAAAGRFGAWIPSVSRFDISMFSLSASEAALTDPQQRQLLEATHALTISPGSAPVFAATMGLPALSSSSRGSVGLVGVAVGISVVDYSRKIPVAVDEIPSPYVGAGVAVSVACGRISYIFGFRGPCIAIDTACSSSLVAAHFAWGEIVGGTGPTIAGFVAAGSTLILAPHITRIFSAAGMLAADGRCKTLDASADGYVRAEATWTLPLWSLTVDSSAPVATATANVVRAAALAFVSSATNQDGRSGALTAPNGPSQQAVLTSAVRAAVPNLEDIEYALEMHGTGTQLGDPIEFGAAFAVMKAMRDGAEKFKEARSRGFASDCSPVSFSAVKSSVGHTEAAAGVFGLLHAGIQLVQRGGGKLQHLRALTPHAVQVIQRLADEKTSFGIARQNHGSAAIHEGEEGVSSIKVPTSGISSFAFQGTNAHAVICARDNNADMLKHQSIASERAIFWCAPMLPAILTRACTSTHMLNSINELTTLIQVDLTTPNNAGMLQSNSSRSKKMISAEVLLFIVTSVTLTTVRSGNVEDRQQLSCVSISLPSMDVTLQKNINIRLHMDGGNITASKENMSAIHHAPLLLCSTSNTSSYAKETNTRKQRINLQRNVNIQLTKLMCHGSIQRDVFGIPFTMLAFDTDKMYSRRQILSVEASKIPSAMLEDIGHNWCKRVFSSMKRADGLTNFASCSSWIVAGIYTIVLRSDEQITHEELKPQDEGSSAVSPKSRSLKLLHTFLWCVQLVSNLLKSKSSAACNTANLEHTGTSAQASDLQKSYQALLDNVLEILNSDGSETLHAESSLVEAGIDSLRIHQLQMKLEELGPPGFSFSNGKVFDFTTPTALANCILSARQSYGSAIIENSAVQRSRTGSIRKHGVDQQSIATRVYIIRVCLSIFFIPLFIAVLHFCRKGS